MDILVTTNSGLPGKVGIKTETDN